MGILEIQEILNLKELDGEMFFLNKKINRQKLSGSCPRKPSPYLTKMRTFISSSSTTLSPATPCKKNLDENQRESGSQSYGNMLE
jgi:hypothetical protein